MKRIGCAIVLLTLLACEADDPCDEGERHVQGACIADDAEPAPDSGKAAECDEDRAAILGNACNDDGACNCAAPYCAKMPGQMSGVCTVYCEPDPGDCPDGYECFDLSALGVEGYDPFCLAE